MFDDAVVEEIRRARREHAGRFDNDLAAIVADIRRMQQESGREYVNFPAHRCRDENAATSTSPLKRP